MNVQGVDHFPLCPRCYEDFDRISRVGRGWYICWCKMCEHTFTIQITDCCSDPIQDVFGQLLTHMKNGRESIWKGARL